MIKHLPKFAICTVAVLGASVAFANLEYNPEHYEALKKLEAVQSATINVQYHCGKYSLILSAFATESEVNGRDASVTGKIVSEDNAFDVSKDLSKAISRHDILTGQINVSCNRDKGVFRLDFKQNMHSQDQSTMSYVTVFWDGTVNSFRF